MADGNAPLRKHRYHVSATDESTNKKAKLDDMLPGSLKRASGSMFASEIIRKLTSNPQTKKTLQEEFEDTWEESTEVDDEQLEEQDESYTEFSKTVYDTLFELDRRGYEQWEADPGLHPGDFLNRNRHVSKE